MCWYANTINCLQKKTLKHPSILKWKGNIERAAGNELGSGTNRPGHKTMGWTASSFYKHGCKIKNEKRRDIACETSSWWEFVDGRHSAKEQNLCIIATSKCFFHCSISSLYNMRQSYLPFIVNTFDKPSISLWPHAVLCFLSFSCYHRLTKCLLYVIQGIKSSWVSLYFFLLSASSQAVVPTLRCSKWIKQTLQALGNIF